MSDEAQRAEAEFYEVAISTWELVLTKLVLDTRASTPTFGASAQLLSRVIDSWHSLRTLHRHATHNWELDGVSVLRTMYDAHLQLGYLLHDPDLSANRAADFFDFPWIERFAMRKRLDRSSEDIGKAVAQSPRRQQATPAQDEKLRQIGHRFLTRDGQREHAVQGDEYLTSPKAKYRREWYSDKLERIANIIGIPGEHDLFYVQGHQATHSSPLVLDDGSCVQREHQLFIGMRIALRAADITVQSLKLEVPPFESQVLRDARRSIYQRPPL